MSQKSYQPQRMGVIQIPHLPMMKFAPSIRTTRINHNQSVNSMNEYFNNNNKKKN